MCRLMGIGLHVRVIILWQTCQIRQKFDGIKSVQTRYKIQTTSDAIGHNNFNREQNWTTIQHPASESAAQFNPCHCWTLRGALSRTRSDTHFVWKHSSLHYGSAWTTMSNKSYQSSNSSQPASASSRHQHRKNSTSTLVKCLRRKTRRKTDVTFLIQNNCRLPHFQSPWRSCIRLFITSPEFLLERAWTGFISVSVSSSTTDIHVRPFVSPVLHSHQFRFFIVRRRRRLSLSISLFSLSLFVFVPSSSRVPLVIRTDQV